MMQTARSPMNSAASAVSKVGSGGGLGPMYAMSSPASIGGSAASTSNAPKSELLSDGLKKKAAGAAGEAAGCPLGGAVGSTVGSKL